MATHEISPGGATVSGCGATSTALTYWKIDMATITVRDLQDKVDLGQGDQTVRIKVNRSMLVGNRVTSPGEIVKTTVFKALQLVKEEVALVVD
jgi:hypothetical protein